MNQTTATHSDLLAPLTQEVRRSLDLAAGQLPHDISERLRVSRQRALAVRKPEPQTVLALQSADGLPLSDEPGSRVWRLLMSSLPLLALVAGLVFWQQWQQESSLTELARIDTALLTDELPPAAYTDPGFAHFLKQRRQTEATGPAGEGAAGE